MTDPKPELLVDSSKKWKNFVVRSVATFVMLGIFSFLLYLGHESLSLLVLTVVTLMFFEVSKFGVRAAQERSLPPGSRMVHMHLLFSMLTYVVYKQLNRQVLSFQEHLGFRGQLSELFQHMVSHQYIYLFSLFCSGVVWYGDDVFILSRFVIALKKGHYKYQFQQLAWTVMALLFCVWPSTFALANIYEGLFWFLLPASLVVCNDCTAYLFGFFFGRTPLIRVSPKKTWEGFIGATFSTLLFAFYFSKFLAGFPFFVCPKDDMDPYDEFTACDIPEAFRSREFTFDYDVKTTLMPVQLHALALAAFASIIGPFGGFLASGFKRAFKIKDFGDLIPGHGGFTDRMDCQLLMAVFTWAYFHTFVIPMDPVARQVMRVTRLPEHEQLEVLKILAAQLNITCSI